MTAVSAAECTYAAALCAGCAAWFAVGEGAARRRAWLLLADVSDGPSAGRALRGTPWARRIAWLRRRAAATGREWLCVPVAVLLALAGSSVLPLVAGAVAVPLVRRRLRAVERHRERELLSEGVIALCASAAGELRAGLQPAQALMTAAASTGGLGAEEAAVLAAVRFGGDVPAVLRQAARRPGADGLVGLAACWQVAVDGGAGLAAGLDRLESALRGERDQREGLRAQLAGAWSTVVVLALLPAVGIGLGSAMGAQPLRVLLHTPAGAACLAVGALLEALGLWWAGRIVRAGESL